MTGTVQILNVGKGDTTLSFNKNNPMECARAARVVKDMLRRGYALFIQVGTDKDKKPLFQRVHEFDDKTDEYIIGDFDPVTAQEADREEAQQKAVQEKDQEARPTEPVEESSGKRGRGRPGKRRVPAGSTKAVAVARSAGG